MPHPTPLALSTADRTLVDALADAFQAYAPADTSAIARQRALVAMDAIDGHMGGDWLVVRVDAEAKTRQAIFDDTSSPSSPTAPRDPSCLSTAGSSARAARSSTCATPSA
jgi:hypothetical protein